MLFHESPELTVHHLDAAGYQWPFPSACIQLHVLGAWGGSSPPLAPMKLGYLLPSLGFMCVNSGS